MFIVFEVLDKATKIVLDVFERVVSVVARLVKIVLDVFDNEA